MSNLLRYYKKELSKAIDGIDSELGLCIDEGFFTVLMQIKNDKLTTEESRLLFEEKFKYFLTVIPAERLLPFKSRLLSIVLDYADLCNFAFLIDPSIVDWYKEDNTSQDLSVHYYDFPCTSFIFEYSNELYRCYKKKDRSIIECIGVGSKSAQASYRTSVRNLENDIICELEKVACMNDNCPRKKDTNCACSMFDAMHCGQFDSTTPLDIVVVAKAIMCAYKAELLHTV